MRIQQAELEYQLGREELNLLSLLEETRNVAALLEEAERARSSQAANTLYRWAWRPAWRPACSFTITFTFAVHPHRPRRATGGREMPMLLSARRLTWPLALGS